MRDFFISAGRVCFVIFIVGSCLVTVYQAIMAMHYAGFFWGVCVFISGVFTIMLIGYVVSLLEDIHDRTGKRDQRLDMQQSSEISKIKKDLEKGLQSINEIRDILNFQSKNLSALADVSTDSDNGREPVTPKADSESSGARAAESAPAFSWSKGIKHS
ncbi:hypothetical protein [Succinimonas sp.]|uniref:hypothetical protein n=1 Tax=Succinimonas sp. TaxID=1936151 RepID=UPI00386B9295